MEKCESTFRHTSASTVKKIVKDLDSKKATGCDSIPAKLLKLKCMDQCIHLPLTIEDHDTLMPLDTGCSLSLAPRQFYDGHLHHLKLNPTKVILSTTY
jgi:hypothetical protein